jgi:hypothetical protein
MRNDRVARALLRLYPHEWRERYGDEFLALIAESGLSWRAAVDILIVATIERVRRLLELARAEMAPPSPLPPITAQTDRELFLTHLGHVALVSALIFTCTRVGLASPQWTVWMQLFFMSDYFDSEVRVTRATIGERIVLTFAWFMVAMWIAIVGWLVGDGLRRLGIPEPSDGLFLIVIGVPMLAGFARLVYRGVASALNKPRPAITRREFWAWSVPAFAFAVFAGMVDPFGRLIWTTGFVWSLWLGFLRTQRVRAARRQELRDQRGF